MQKDASRRRFPLADRLIEVIDDTLTGEVLLDETLKMMKTSEKMSVSSWIDLLSGMALLSFLSPFSLLRHQALSYSRKATTFHQNARNADCFLIG